jgi:hypothetical protein
MQPLREPHCGFGTEEFTKRLLRIHQQPGLLTTASWRIIADECGIDRTVVSIEWEWPALPYCPPDDGLLVNLPIYRSRLKGAIEQLGWERVHV